MLISKEFETKMKVIKVNNVELINKPIIIEIDNNITYLRGRRHEKLVEGSYYLNEELILAYNSSYHVTPLTCQIEANDKVIVVEFKGVINKRKIYRTGEVVLVEEYIKTYDNFESLLDC